MKRIAFVSLLITLLTVPQSAESQRPPRNKIHPATQKTDINYDSIRRRRIKAAELEAEIKERLAEVRDLFAQDGPGKEMLGRKIVELEENLFAIRREMDSIDAELLAAGKTEISLPPAPTGHVRNGKGKGESMIVKNDYFAENLPEDSYKMLLEAQSNEAKVTELIEELQRNYGQLSVLLPVYYLAEKGLQADSIFSRISFLAGSNEEIAGSIGDLWGDVFDTKVYVYNYLIDKSGDTELLREQERQMNNLMLLQAEIKGEYMYDEVAYYALQKLLITGYEQRLADMAELAQAADSLGSLVPPTNHIEDFFLPVLDTRERMFYDFADFGTSRPTKYGSGNPIPPVEIFPRGDIYRILLGAYSKAQPAAIFKGVYPLSREVKADRKHYYYAGGYRTYTEAKEAAARLKRMGFRNPRVVAWYDGRYDHNPRQSDSSAPIDTKSTSDRVYYRVEITGAGESLSRVIRDVISRQAAGKEISRSVDPSNGKTVFTVGSFNTKDAAESLVGEINKAEPDLKAKTVSTR